jgi:type II secretory pathway component PulK
MQRKGDFLMKRRGFGIITAIVLMVLVGVIGAVIIGTVTTASKKSTDDYLRIQAEMLARSATEFAVMRIQGFNRTVNNNCLQNIDINATPFDINTTINYLFINGTVPANCTNLFSNAVTDPDLNGMAIIDVVVTEQVADINNPDREPIRIHKRTLQKP